MVKPADTTGDAPRCPKCGYVLLGLPEFRCPECGTSFDAEYVEDAPFRIHLLPWERPEAGGRVGRLARTLVQASLHPGRFFTSVGKRKDRRIAHAGKLIAACVLAAVCFYVAAFLVDRTAFFVRLLVKDGQPSRALDTVLRALSITWSTELLLPLTQMLWVLLSVVVMAALISRLFRGKLGSLRSLDIAAVYSSAVAFGAFIAAFAQVVLAVSFGTLSVVMYGAVWGQMVVLLLLLWFTCRRLLSLSRWKTVEMLIIGVIVEFGCGAAVSWLLWRLPFLISHGLL